MIQRIRMLKSLATGRSLFEQGRVYHVPEDLPEYMAAGWVRTGAAEEDKSIDRAPEIKVGPNVTIKVSEMPIKKGKKKRS